jgi:hypothetical protein
MSVFQLKDFVDDGMEGHGLLTDPIRTQKETQEGEVQEFPQPARLHLPSR